MNAAEQRHRAAGHAEDGPSEPDPEPELVQLAESYGIATRYWDWQGRHVQVPRSTIVQVLWALDVDASTPDRTAAALHASEHQRWRQPLPPFLAARAGTSIAVPLHPPHGATVRVWVELEDGTRRDDVVQRHHLIDPREVDGVLVGEAMFDLPADLPVGYHQLCVAIHVPEVASAVHAGAASTGEEYRCPLAVTPSTVTLPERLRDERVWGLAVQLYSVRSTRSWGLGDLVDLGDLAVWSADELGADFVLVNPLQAGDPVVPVEPSPYLPTTRQYTSPLYIRVEAIEELAYAEPDVRARVDGWAAERRTDNTSAALLDRDAAWTAKLAALDLLRRVPRSVGREAEYQAFRARESQALLDFATWCVLAEQHGTRWRQWPEELRDPRSAQVRQVRERYAERIDLFCYAQWIAETQLAAAQRRAHEAGMALGIVGDLPVGVHPDGADAWALSDVLATDINVGAPPDAFNQQGQDWSQPPWRPDQLAACGYEPWRQLVRRLLRHGGGLRVDHIVGLFRLWWVPAGADPTAGTYIRYDHEAMLGILALEAERAGVVLIGEDLGTVEPWVRDVLAERGILGTSVAWFEYTDDGRLRPPEDWRRLCLATVTVHDLPPTAAYLEGAHVRLRNELSVLTQPLVEERAAFEAERSRWIHVLYERGLLPRPDPATPDTATPDTATLVEAMHRYVTHAPARLLGVSLADAVGDRRTQNQPGTHREYPNWRFPLCDEHGRPVLLDELPRRADVWRLAHAVGTPPAPA